MNLTSYQPLRRFQGPLTAAGVGEIVSAPRTAAEGNLGETIRLLALALLQASDADGCPCCGEDADLPEGHLAGCCWPELVRLGYVDAARPAVTMMNTAVRRLFVWVAEAAETPPDVCPLLGGELDIDEVEPPDAPLKEER